MMTTLTPPTLPCVGCATWIRWPRWARVSPNRYCCLCWPCYERLDLDFTPQAAIQQAREIVRSAVPR